MFMRLATFIALLCCTAVQAHEIGTTRVSVLFHDGRTYEIQVVTDATALAEKLAAGRSLPADASPAHIQSLLAGSDENFRRRVEITFDAAAVRPAIAYSI